MVVAHKTKVQDFVDNKPKMEEGVNLTPVTGRSFNQDMLTTMMCSLKKSLQTDEERFIKMAGASNTSS